LKKCLSLSVKKLNNLIKYRSNIKLLITFFLLWTTTFLNHQAEEYLAYLMILTVGILHGSNDIELLFGFIDLKRNQTYKIVASYIFIILVTALLFYILPSVTLIFFVFFSAYHFGEQHFVRKVTLNHFRKDLFFLSYGLMIFFLLFYLNDQEVVTIIEHMTGLTLSKMFFLIGLLISIIFTVVFGATLQLESQLKANLFRESFLVLVFFIIFKFATVLWAFAIYFIVWHAYPSIIDQLLMLKGRMKEFSLTHYIKTSLAYWLISVAGIGALFFLTSENPELFNSLFFTFIAAISFPHIYVIRKMNSDA